MKENQKNILNEIRKNSRMGFARIGRKFGIPVSTVFDYFYSMQGFFDKYVSLIDFKKIGLGIRVFFIVKSKNKKELFDFLDNCLYINNIFELKDYDYCFDALFFGMRDFHDFQQELNKIELEEIHSHFLTEVLKYEEFSGF
jgi:DNA-binding Lrp family transcriptional regulator